MVRQRLIQFGLISLDLCLILKDGLWLAMIVCWLVNTSSLDIRFSLVFLSGGACCHNRTTVFTARVQTLGTGVIRLFSQMLLQNFSLDR